MEQYIPKSTLVAEIKKYYEEYLKRAKIYVYDSNYWIGKADAYHSMLEIIDTLEVKEVDLTPTVYVVTRCEEHSDYVEQVFLDENKAIEYCKQFEGNENEYGRDTTKIEVTL